MMPLILLTQMLIPAAALGFFGWLALRYVRAREVATHNPPETIRPDEMRKLEDVISSLQTEVQALRERQEFVEKLLDKPRDRTFPS